MSLRPSYRTSWAPEPTIDYSDKIPTSPKNTSKIFLWHPRLIRDSSPINRSKKFTHLEVRKKRKSGPRNHLLITVAPINKCVSTTPRAATSEVLNTSICKSSIEIGKPLYLRLVHPLNATTTRWSKAMISSFRVLLVETQYTIMWNLWNIMKRSNRERRISYINR